MQHCAKALMDFNGGNSCVQIYVNQHTFFISKSSLFAVDTDGYSQLCVVSYYFSLHPS